MSEAVTIILISAGISLLTSLGTALVQAYGTRQKNRTDEKKADIDGVSVLTDANIKLIQEQQKQHDRDLMELRETVEDQADTIKRQRDELNLLRTEYFEFRNAHQREMEKRDIEKAILLRQVSDAKKAYDDWRDWALRLRLQVENIGGIVPVPFKPRDTGADIIMDP